MGDMEENRIGGMGVNPLIARMPHPGRPPRFERAEDLWAKFAEYVEFVDSNPWTEAFVAKKVGRRKKKAEDADSVSDAEDGGEGVARAVSRNEKVIRKPYTLYGFCLFAGIPEWRVFKNNNASKEEFQTVIRAIENFVADQQVTGAMIGVFNANIVSRLNSLADLQIVRTATEEMSEEDIRRELERLDRAGM